MRKLIMLSAALLGIAGAAMAQTAGGPDRASPGAMPSATPLTTDGQVRATATPATPADIGANKPPDPALPVIARSRPRHPSRLHKAGAALRHRRRFRLVFRVGSPYVCTCNIRQARHASVGVPE